MKAAVWYGRRDVRIVDVAEPVIAPGKVKIRVACCGICGTDLHEYAAGPIFIPTAPHPLTGQRAPVVLGHEFSGEVTEIGAGVTRVKVGDRVCVEPIISCGECPACIAGKYNLCRSIAFHGISSPDGGAFAEITMVDERMVYPIPDSMSYEQAAIVEPAAMVVHAIRSSRLRVGDSIAVFGAGPIGLLIVEAARAAGASDIIVVETSAVRREHALKMGASLAINPAAEDPVATIAARTSGGVEVAFEASGVKRALSAAIAATTFDGQVVVVSVWEGDAIIEPNQFVFNEKSLLGILGNCNNFPETIALISSGMLRVDSLITRRIGLDDLVADGFDALLGTTKEHVKILVSPN